MSVCLDTNNMLTNSVSTADTLITDVTSDSTSAPAAQSSCDVQQTEVANSQVPKNTAKLVVTNHPSTVSAGNPVLQKVVNPPLITVLNSSGPLTVVKTLCVTSGVSSAPQFTVVNSAPLSVTNTGKSPTITLLNGPLTVVKAIPGTQHVTSTEKTIQESQCNNVTAPLGHAPVPAIIENRTHNVFVKNTCSEAEIPQSHKLLTANNFPQGNLLNISQPTSKVNGQRNKLKILSSVMPSTSQVPNNLILNKPNTTCQQRYMPPQQTRPKVIGPNGATATKYINKPNPSTAITNKQPTVVRTENSPQRMVYPTHKGNLKTLPPVTNYMHKPQGIKTLPPQSKPIPGQVQRTGSGLKTIPAQKPPKTSKGPNYLNKHAVQAPKMKYSQTKLKPVKTSPLPYTSYQNMQMPDKQLTFNQVLTAEILETLGNKTSPSSSYSYKNFEPITNRYESSYCYEKPPQVYEPPPKPVEEKTSPLGALSLICQAVLLDHNYNATLPPDSPTRTVPPQPPQVNGVTSNSLYSPGIKRRSFSSSNTVSATSSMSNLSSLLPSNSTAVTSQDDDAASDISYGSDRKHDTEGEETDTAPEAEMVNNGEDPFDHYGDYVTRCICGFIHDDGYMIECDRCKVWQHVQCVIKNKQVPDEYLCEVCDPSKHVDRQKAKMIQQQWLRDRQFPDLRKNKESKLKEVQRHNEALSDTDSSDQEQGGPNNIINKGRAPLARRKSDSQQKQVPKQRRESTKETNLKKPVKRKERKVVKRKPKVQPKPHSDEDTQDALQATHLPQLRQWIENYEEAVTNHYSPELRARISSIRVNGAHTDLSIQFDSSVQKCRVNTQPLTDIKYLVATMYLPPNTYVIELRGKYMLSTQHRNFGGALTTRQHAQRPGPFLFFYRLHKDNTEVCVDTRTYGNSARFIRRSCKPNAELRHCIEKGVLHLYIVTITTVEKNAELTIKHESHDLAAIGTTLIACACGNATDCTVNRPASKKNGENTEVIQRKRRGRRAVSLSVPTTAASDIQDISPKIKEEPLPLSGPPPPPTPPPSSPVAAPIEPPILQTQPIKEEPQEEIKEESKPPLEDDIPVEEEKFKPKQEEKEEESKSIKKEVSTEEDEEEKPAPAEPACKEEDAKPPIATRRASHKMDQDDHKEQQEQKNEKAKNKKLSREERKLEAILRAIEQMEKADQRKQEHQAKQAHRRESEPGPNSKDDDKSEPKAKRRRRKGRTRTTSSNASSRRNRINSTDSYLTSGDESLMSPNENQINSNSKDGDKMCENREPRHVTPTPQRDDMKQCEKSPIRDDSNNSNSAHSSPETHLSSACLLVQAAVEPLEQGFKFPKTKKGLMNEWLNKVPEPVQSASSISPSSLTPHISISSDYESSSNFISASKNLSSMPHTNFCDSNTIQSHGNAKKRWLRQAIIEDQCDSPTNRPESPPMTDAIAPPKKRRLPRESLSNEESPATTPTNGGLLLRNKLEGDKPEGCVEIVYSTDGDSPNQTLESDAVLKERAAEMKQEFSSCLHSSIEEQANQQLNALSCLMDPRLSRVHNSEMFSNSEHLVGTVEKTLSILGFEDRKPEPITPARRKLSITEYRQRKKQNNSEGIDKIVEEPTSMEDNNSLESFKPIRQRSDSTSSSTSLTSDDDMVTDIPGKASAFNSEPTELERQREISRLRLKKAFGLSLDDEPYKPSLTAIINCELPPVVKPSIPLSSPTFPIPGSLISGSINSASPKSLFSENSLSSQSSPVKNTSSTSEVEKVGDPPAKIDESLETDLKPATSPISEDEMSPLATDQDDEDVKDDNQPVSPMSEGGEKVPSPNRSPEQVEQVDNLSLPEKKSQEEPAADFKASEENENNIVEPTMFYTPDEEEEVAGESGEVESMSYVPPFNNPIYPNTGFTTYTSVIDNDARYESRNPSPPPDLDQASSFCDHQT